MIYAKRARAAMLASSDNNARSVNGNNGTNGNNTNNNNGENRPAERYNGIKPQGGFICSFFAYFFFVNMRSVPSEEVNRSLSSLILKVYTSSFS